MSVTLFSIGTARDFDRESDIFKRCEYLVRTYGPGLMIAGGGGLTREPQTRRWKPIDAEKRKQVIELASSGQFSRSEIAKRAGVAPSTVTRLCASAGLPVFQRGHRQIKPEAERQILRLWQSMRSIKDIAARVGVTWNTVRDCLVRHGRRAA